MLAAGDKAGLVLKNLCVWDKGTGAMGSLYRSQHELVFLFNQPGVSSINNVQLGKFGRNRTNVWAYPGAAGLRKELQLHPTPKPVALVADAIRDASNRNDIVLDAFSGSGTTIIAAAKTGRRARVIELDPRYVDVAIRRWETWSGTSARHVATGATFAELAATRLGAGPPDPKPASPSRARPSASVAAPTPAPTRCGVTDHGNGEEVRRLRSGQGQATQTRSVQAGSERQSGGRPKSSRNVATVLRELANLNVHVNQNGKPQKVPLMKALLLSQVQSALKEISARATVCSTVWRWSSALTRRPSPPWQRETKRSSSVPSSAVRHQAGGDAEAGGQDQERDEDRRQAGRCR